MRREDKYPNTKTFEYYNANPRNKISDDCVVRAICTAMERPYNEVYRELFEYSLKCGYILNDQKCFEKYLESQGWKKQKQPKKVNNTKYTGAEFCKLLSKDISALGKKLIANIGGHHIVCIKSQGALGLFKVYDIWDSTDGCIGNYWTKG